MARDLIFAILITLALSVTLVYSGAAGMSGAVAAGQNEDVWSDLWRYDAVAHLSDKPAPPAGQGLWGPRDILRLRGGFLMPALFAPVTRRLGAVYAHNLAAIAALFLTSVCAFFLFLKLTKAHAPSLIGAILFGCGPFGATALRVGRPEQAAAFAMPLAALLILWKAEKFAWVRLPAAALVAVIGSLIDPYLGAGTLLFLLVLPILIKEQRRSVLRDGAIATLIAAPFVAFALAGVFRIKNEIPTPAAEGVLTEFINYRWIAVPAFLLFCAILARDIRRLLAAGEKVNLSEPIIGRILVAVAAVFCLLASGVKAVPVIVPPAYHSLESDPRPGAVLELTYEKDRRKNWRVLYYQTVHRKPVLLPDVSWSGTSDAIHKNPLLVALSNPGGADHSTVETTLRPAAAELRASGVTHIMIHRNTPEAALAEWIAQQVLGNPIRQDAFGSLFGLP